MKTKTLLTIFSACALALPAAAHDAAKAMADAATDFLNTLDKEQRSLATLEMGADARTIWYFTPRPFEGEDKRIGVPMRDLRQDQRALAFGLLSSGLSHRGFVQATQIMSLEQVLHELENQAPKRNPAMYYISIFGKPGAKAWGWRVEGHHMSVNFTIKDGKVVSKTPIFYASNPAEILEGPRKGLKVLAGEEDIARKLAKSLDDAQKKKAVIEEKPPRDILTGEKSTVEHLGDAGLPVSDLNKKQSKILQELIEVYVRRIRPELADEDLKKIADAGWDKVHFAWAGSFKNKEPHSYRIQGPTFVFEYANTQNGANHVHAVWREFDGDFGRDVLREHLAAFPH